MSYTAKVIAVLGRTLRAGRWKLADDSLVIAVFGRCVLDLSRAYVDEEDDELSMTVIAVFGSVSIVLPPGCDVEPSGIALLASSEVEIPSDKIEDVTADVLAPLDISWFAMFGRVRINELMPEPEPEPEPAPEETLPPPATEVFDDQASTATTAAPTEAKATPAPPLGTPTVDAEAEQAALRDEIAQWRSETGRPEQTDSVDPAGEIEDDASDPAESKAEAAADAS